MPKMQSKPVCYLPWLGLLLLAVCLCLPSPVAQGKSPAEPVYPGKEWTRATDPAEMGWSVEKLARARKFAQSQDTAAVMIVQNGVVVDAWGVVARKYKCHSMRKSLFSALMGLAVADGKISLDSSLAELGIDDKPPALSAEEKTATVGDLIKARSGIYHPALAESPDMKAGRPARHSHAPGTHWFYNNWDFNALGSIYRQKTGGDIYRDFDAKIARPLGMQDFDPAECAYSYHDPDETVPASIHPAYPFRMSTRDLARFGLLYLRGGEWKGEQVLPADWIAESTSPHSRVGPGQGYGYMWWTGEDGGPFPGVRLPGRVYYASGYRGHRLFVIPELDLVVAHRVDTDQPGTAVNAQDMGRLLWLILDAAGCPDIGDPPVLATAPGERLTPEHWQGLFADGSRSVRTLMRGGQYMVTYLSDGTMELRQAGEQEVLRHGHWQFKDGRFCISWQGQGEPGPICLDVYLAGDAYWALDSRGVVMERGRFELK